MTEDYEYFVNKRPDRTYISKPFNSLRDLSNQKLRIISRVFDHEESHEFSIVKGEIVLRVTSGQRDEVKATFYEDSREIRSLTFQRYANKGGRPHKGTCFTFRGKEIEQLYNFLRLIARVPLYGEIKMKIDDDVLEDLLTTVGEVQNGLPGDLQLELDDSHILDHLLIGEEEKRKYVLDNWETVTEILRNDITKADVAAWTYRKQQLELFEQLLHDDVFFETIKQEWNKVGAEAVWQQFFEDNPWIFGYGLNYIFTSRLGNRKLEQVVAGYDIEQSGKRVDALMRTKGLISSLCFVEIKTHETLLLDKKSYRSESWPISDELAGGVSQVQKTVQKAIENIRTKLELRSAEGDLTGEYTFLYQPKAYLVIGSLDEFSTEIGVNEQKFSSFELFRRNIVNPEIITFDELFERACFIVQHSESEKPFASNEGESQSRNEKPLL